jgi:hypothetical protein
MGFIVVHFCVDDYHSGNMCPSQIHISGPSSVSDLLCNTMKYHGVRYEVSSYSALSCSYAFGRDIAGEPQRASVPIHEFLGSIGHIGWRLISQSESVLPDYSLHITYTFQPR